MTAVTMTPLVAETAPWRPAPDCSWYHCGRKADAIHLVDNVDGGYPRYGVTVRFSCPRHDCGGYTILLADFESDPGSYLDHLAGKWWRGDLALVRAGLA